jgi:D-xylulose reductase
MLLYGPGDARLEDRPIPTIEDPYDVIVRIGYVGVCGSDVHFWTEGGIGDRKVSQEKPLTMGHEACGTVSSIGSAVTRLKVGDNVAIEPGFPCRRCEECKRGDYHLCDYIQFAVVPPDCHGCLTKFFRVPEDFCHRLSGDGFDLELQEGVLAEPLAVAVHVVRQAGSMQDKNVVISGAGTIGFACASVALAYGARCVCVCDIADSRLQFSAEKLACKIFNLSGRSAKENADALRHHLSGQKVDYVLECSGAEPAMQTGIYLLRTGGTLVQAGLGKSIQAVPILLLSEKEVVLRGTYRYGAGDFARAISLLSRGKVDLKPLISTVTPFERATEAWEKTRKGEGIKNLIEGPKD